MHNGGGAAYSVLGKYTEETSNNGDRIEYATDIYVLYISFATRESKINTRCIYIYIYIELFEEGLLVGGCVGVPEKVPVNRAV